jgi:uncharacterized protein YbaR (Trm112 family)
VFIELVDALRCPHPHEESWLVLAATRIDARHIREGALGCPVCRAEYPIRDGIADFRLADERGSAQGRRATGAESAPLDEVSAEHLVALLGLGDALGFVVLAGEWGTRAPDLLDTSPMPPLLLVDPPDDVAMVPGMSGVRGGPSLPLAAGAARAVAVDHADATRLASAVHVTRAGGRIVAPAAAVIPDGVRELARSDAVWVGEREAPPSALVRLHVRRG